MSITELVDIADKMQDNDITCAASLKTVPLPGIPNLYDRTAIILYTSGNYTMLIINLKLRKFQIE